MSNPTHAVFLSYAHDDAAAARRIAEALRSSGIEVWFDESELRGGDAWDAKIRRQIDECALFVPIISARTQERSKGYFRLEWKLAVEQTHLLAEGVPFVAPVAIDDTRETGALVPAEFLRVQWTRLPGALPTPQFVAQVKRLLDATDKAAAGERPVGAPPAAKAGIGRSGIAKWVAAGVGVALLALVAFIVLRPFAQEPATVAAAKPGANAKAAPAAGPDSNSVAVLPFANLSSDKDNEYFSDGISEELLTVLQKISGLHVAARLSSFSFKGKNATAQEIGEKLGVVHLVEGSVQKSGNSVRITARLSRAATGEQLWADGYTRDLKDVFAVQGELAQTIAEQLRGQLGAVDPSAKAAIQAQVQAAVKGGTTNVEAHQLYLQGISSFNQSSRKNTVKAADFLQRAVALDPAFALAWAALSQAAAGLGSIAPTKRETDDEFALARRAADRALALEPDLPSAHLARMKVQGAYEFDWKGAAASLRRAQQVAPTNADVIAAAAQLAHTFGRKEEAVELARQAVSRDPVNIYMRAFLAMALSNAGQPKEAEAELRRAMEINPHAAWLHTPLAENLLRQKRFDEAVLEVERAPSEVFKLTVRAMALWSLNKRRESDAALARLTVDGAETAAYQIAQVHAHRREADHAFEWLERAFRQHDSGLINGKPDLFFATLYDDPRWPAFLRKVGLADEQLK